MRLFKAMLSTLTFGMALTLATSAIPLLAQQVTTDYDHSVDFSQFHTYSFGKVKASDPLYDQRIRDEVSRQLTARGWQMAPSGGDITIHAIGGMKTQQEYSTFYDGLGGGGFGWRRGWGGGGFGDSFTTVNEIPVGTLVIDLYATDTHKLVFRGTASGQLSNNAEKNTKELDKAIDKIFQKLPQKSK